jgi:hypothetical protein
MTPTPIGARTPRRSTFFGVGYAMYCAGQGMARMGWPVAGALVRTVIAVAGGALAAAHFQEPVWIFAAASAGMLAFAIVSIGGLAPRRILGATADAREESSRALPRL